jgi:predicted secreted protein
MITAYRLLIAALLAFATIPALATPQASQIELTASAQREVPNDQLDAVLYLVEQQSQPAALADKLNRKSRLALAIARAYPNVETRSGPSSSWPLYDANGQIQSWQGRVEIQLASVNFVQSAELVGRLQEFMLLQSIKFSVSDAMRLQTEQLMLPGAIRQLQDTARIAAQALGKKQVVVRSLNITRDGGTPRLQSGLSAKRTSVSGPVTPPDWQPGQTRVRIRVEGKLEIR